MGTRDMLLMAGGVAIGAIGGVGLLIVWAVMAAASRADRAIEDRRRG